MTVCCVCRIRGRNKEGPYATWCNKVAQCLERFARCNMQVLAHHSCRAYTKTPFRRARRKPRLRVSVWNIERSSLTSCRIKGTRLRRAYNEIYDPLQRPLNTPLREHRCERLRVSNSEDRLSFPNLLTAPTSLSA